MKMRLKQLLDIENVGDVTVVRFTQSDVTDERNIQIISNELFSLVGELGRKKIVLNLGNVRSISASAWAILVALEVKLRNEGRLVICNIRPQIYEVLEVMEMKMFFNVSRNEKTALKEFA